MQFCQGKRLRQQWALDCVTLSCVLLHITLVHFSHNSDPISLFLCNKHCLVWGCQQQVSTYSAQLTWYAFTSMGDMRHTFYLWIRSKMTLHPLSEREKRKRRTGLINYASERHGRKDGQAQVRHTQNDDKNKQVSPRWLAILLLVTITNRLLLMLHPTVAWIAT